MNSRDNGTKCNDDSRVSGTKCNDEKIEIVDDLSFDLSKPHVSREQIQDILQMKCINLEYYRIALIHKSLLKIVNNRKEINVPVEEYMFSSNERLEFLGDSIFNSVVTCIIYKKYEDKDEGLLTRIRTKIVRSSHCVIFARNLGLHKHILTSNKILGIGNGVNDKRMINDRVLEDAFEAFIGAIYLDLGYKYAELFIKRLVDTMVDFNEILKDDNYKDILMRYTQAYGYELPVYKEIIRNVTDSEDSSKFTMSVQLVPLADRNEISGNEIKDICYGSGNSKKEAEQNAAKNLCSLLDSNLKHIINRDS